MSDLAGRGIARAQGSVAQVRQLGTHAVQRAGSTANTARNSAGALTATGNGAASGNGSAALPHGMLAAAGSGAAAGEGAVAIAPGMPVMNPQGVAVGKVRQLVSDSRGRVEQVVVESKGRAFALPANHFAANGTALVMGEGTLSGGQTAPDEPATTEAPTEPAAEETHR